MTTIPGLWEGPFHQASVEFSDLGLRAAGTRERQPEPFLSGLLRHALRTSNPLKEKPVSIKS